MTGAELDALVRQIDLGRENQRAAVRAALEALLVRGQRGVIFADEVGCGKTYEALATVSLLWRHLRDTASPIRRVLVIAKPALMPKWFDEMEVGGRFPEYVKGDDWGPLRAMLQRVHKIESTRTDAGRGVKEDGRFQVPPGRIYLVKPSLLTEDGADAAEGAARWLRRTSWDVVIADEAHHYAALRNRIATVFFPGNSADRRREGLQARFLLALTATPFQLQPAELINLLRVAEVPPGDLELIGDGLRRYDRALESFYARRTMRPAEPARRRAVETLHELRSKDASGGSRPGTPGLETLLRRYLIRNVKDASERDYALTERDGPAILKRSFAKLDDVRGLIARSPLIPFDDEDAWFYLNLRDLVADAAVTTLADGSTRPTFVAGDLRQGLSSYDQTLASALLQREDLPAARHLRELVGGMIARGRRHPKVRALCDVVDRILVHEISRMRDDLGASFHKVLIFNGLLKTAGALKAALEQTVTDRLDPFVAEELERAGLRDREHAARLVRAALAEEREVARAQLDARFAREHVHIDAQLLSYAGIESAGAHRHIVDVMFERAERHCTQPLFLLRLARWLRGCGFEPDEQTIHDFVMQRVGNRLARSLATIVDDFLDDTPAQGIAFSEDNRERAAREIARLARVLGAPEPVGRFDGDQGAGDRELRKENFNRPYAPLILLVSSVGEEGIDLQRHTRYVLHYDVEWNPAKMEQREGRVDREGRRTIGAVNVQFFLLKDTYEERIFHTVMQRDAWFQVLIGSKRQELARGGSAEEESADAEIPRRTACSRRRNAAR
jgi:hypothetical protein